MAELVTSPSHCVSIWFWSPDLISNASITTVVGHCSIHLLVIEGFDG